MSGALFWIDLVAAAVLLGRALANLNDIDRTTKHCYRLINIVMAVGSAGVLTLAPVDLDLWIGGLKNLLMST